MRRRSLQEWSEMVRRVAEAPTEDFAALVRAAGLDPTTELRFGDFSGVSFRNSDLRGFDFCGAKLYACDFTGARIEDARFDAAEIGAVTITRPLARGYDAEPGTHTRVANLAAAADWNTHLTSWRPWEPQDMPADRHLRSGAIFRDAPFAPEMVVVPPGTFTMGSPQHEKERTATEGPQRQVVVSQPFAVGRYAVTRGQYSAYCRAIGSKTTKAWNEKEPAWYNPGYHQDDSHPAVFVSWHDARGYASWLTRTTGKHYRLLTEAEWEYCCRAGTTTPFWWGTSITPEEANYEGNFVYEGGGEKGRFRQGTVPVDRFVPNPWGLYQMHGNTWEWCEDGWNSDHREAPLDTSARFGDEQVIRGGSWYTKPGNLRSAYRTRFSGVESDGSTGFRVARTLSP